MYIACFLFIQNMYIIPDAKIDVLHSQQSLLIFVVQSHNTHLSGSCRRRSRLLFSCPLFEYVMV